jgi:hypothetical protein
MKWSKSYYAKSSVESNAQKERYDQDSDLRANGS